MFQLVQPITEAPTSDACPTDAADVLPIEQADRLSEIFKALADPTRVRLLAHISGARHGTVCACHFPDLLGISQPTLSHHLKKLVDAGLVTREQRGRWAHYTAVPEAMAVARDFLAGPTD